MMHNNTSSRFVITKLHRQNFYSWTRYSFGYFEAFLAFSFYYSPMYETFRIEQHFQFQIAFIPTQAIMTKLI